MMSKKNRYVAVLPAAGIGQRMASPIPKQYLPLAGATVIEHSAYLLLAHRAIDALVIALHPDDQWFKTLPLARHPKVTTVIGGSERADSVLAALDTLDESDWVLVHDAARPCLSSVDLDKVIALAQQGEGGILAAAVRDTMKRSDDGERISQTICRENLWHALTPQSFSCAALRLNLRGALKAGATVTDEASAMEWGGQVPLLIEGQSSNIKVTRPEDLELAEFFLSKQQRQL
jgi:2-C-methyl-D-erythritol 4-phosphate cytidylyltransferase